VIIEHHRRASSIVTSNRVLEEWIPLFDDPILAQSAPDRLAHNAHQVIIKARTTESGKGPAGKRRRPRRRHASGVLETLTPRLGKSGSAVLKKSEQA
jgi:hypothetical protein